MEKCIYCLHRALAWQCGDHPDDDHAQVPDWACEPDRGKQATACLDNPAAAFAVRRDVS